MVAGGSLGVLATRRVARGFMSAVRWLVGLRWLVDWRVVDWLLFDVNSVLGVNFYVVFFSL